MKKILIVFITGGLFFIFACAVDCFMALSNERLMIRKQNTMSHIRLNLIIFHEKTGEYPLAQSLEEALAEMSPVTEYPLAFFPEKDLAGIEYWKPSNDHDIILRFRTGKYLYFTFHGLFRFYYSEVEYSISEKCPGKRIWL